MELIVRIAGRDEHVEVERLEHGFQVRVGERSFHVDSVDTNGMVRSLLIDGRQYEVGVRRDRGSGYEIHQTGGIDRVEVMDPLTYLAEESRGGSGASGREQVAAYMPGRVVLLMVEEGDRVEAGQGLVVLEAMKMENEIQAQRAGVVSRIHVEAGQAVEGGDPLFDIE